MALGVFFARDCINEVPNILYPESYAERILEKLEETKNEKSTKEYHLGKIRESNGEYVAQLKKESEKLVLFQERINQAKNEGCQFD